MCDAVPRNEKVGQKKNKERLKIDQQGCPGSVGLAETHIHQGQLYGEDQGKNQQLRQLFLVDTKRSPGELGPETDGERGHCEPESCRCEGSQPGEADFDGYRIGSEDRAEE